MNFLNIPPTSLTGALASSEGASSIADASGNLLMYTNSIQLWDQTGSIMTGGSALFGNTSTTQGSIIVKQPGSNTIYYVFTLASGGGLLTCYTVDMTLSGGLGAVTGSQYLTFYASEKLAAVKHCNGTDVWVVAHGITFGLTNNSNSFFSYLVTSAGVSPVVVSTAGIPLTGNGGIGQMKISPDGKKLGMVQFLPNGPAELFNFNNTTGVVSDPLVLDPSINDGYGCEFSPDGSKFYATAYGSGKLYQWDLCQSSSLSIPASENVIQATTSYSVCSLQLAPNGKIYIAYDGAPYLGVINAPNQYGNSYNFVNQDQILNTGTHSTFALPAFISSFFNGFQPNATFSYTNGVSCSDWSFTSPLCALTFTNLSWDFGDPASGSANTSTLSNPSHVYTGLGTYTPKLYLYHDCGGIDLLQASISITPCITVTNSPISCSSPGSATASASSGGLYTYTWIPSNQTGSVATGLNPGTYTLQVHEASSNTTYTFPTTFTSPVPFTGTLSSNTPTGCPGTAFGTASFTAITGGSGSQHYSWTNGPVTYTVPSPNTLPAGNWSVVVTDVLTGCAINQTFAITTPPALSLTISAPTLTACAGSSIALTGTASGGSPGYTYTWTAGPFTNTQTVSENVPGNYTYTLTASDSHDCPVSQTITRTFISNPPLSVSDVSICPSQTATLSVSGASTYTWSNGTTGSIFIDSPAATQQYTVRGSVGSCTSSAVASIVLKPVPVLNIVQSGSVCQGGSITFSASGGAGYAWSGPLSYFSPQSSNTIHPVQPAQAGIYTVIVTAANGCTATGTTVFTVNPLPLLSIAPVSPSICLNTNSRALVANGTATQFSWSPLSGLAGGNTQTVIANPTLTTVYTVTGTLNGCSTTTHVTLSVVPPPNLSISLSSSSLCAQLFNGSPNTVTLTSGGANTYSINVPNHIANSNPSGPASMLSMQPPYNPTGPATATLYGSNGACTVSTTAVFTIVPNPTVSVSNPTPVICAGQNYTYTSSGAGSFTWSAASPGSTVYTTGSVTVANPTITSIFSVFGGSLGCNSPLQSSTITVNPIPQVVILPNPPFVCPNGVLTLTATGNPGSTYSWSPSPWMSGTSGATVTINPPQSQTYGVIISLNSCTNSAATTASLLPSPVPTITALKQSGCAGDTIVLQGRGGVGYSWTGPGDLTATGANIKFKVLSAASSGFYTLTVTDHSLCTGRTTQSITVFSLPQGYLTPGNMQYCVPFCADLAFHLNPASSSLTALNWQVNSHQFNGDKFRDCFSSPGNYLISGLMTDINTCVNTVTAVINAYPKPVADFSFSPDQPVEGVDAVQFTDRSKLAVLFNWDFGNKNLSTHQNPVLVYPDAGLYPVAFVAKTAFGCSDTVVKTITIAPDFALYVPNAFTPNNDGHNELFRPVMRGVAKFTFSIYDRWGTKIFETSDAAGGWDGTYKGEPCKEDTYVWKLVLSKQAAQSGHSEDRAGQLLLYR